MENEAPLASDGNQNNQQSPDDVILNKSHSDNNEESNNELNNKSLMKTTINQLKEICEELCSQIMSMKSDGDDRKDKICAEEIKSDADEDDDDDEEEEEEEEDDDKRCIKSEKEKSRGGNNSLLVSELQNSRRIIAELETKLNALNATTDTKKVTVQTDTDELILLNAFNDSCETLHHASVESLNIRKTIDVVTQTSPPVLMTAIPVTIDSSNSDNSNSSDNMNDQSSTHQHISPHKSQLMIDHSIADKNLDDDFESDSVADDMKMLCDPNIEREEQLIAFKEHCAELTKSNLSLKNQLNDVQMKLSNGHSIISNRLAIVAPIAIVIICWLILPYF